MAVNDGILDQPIERELAESWDNPWGQTGYEARSEQNEAEELEVASLLASRRERMVRVERSIPEIGTFKTPQQASYQAFARFHDTDEFNLQFSETEYRSFDAIVAQRAFEEKNFDFNPLTSDRHDLHGHYAPLRKNIAIVRNFIYSKYFNNSRYGNQDTFNAWDPEEAHCAAILPQIAEMLGEALYKGKQGTAPGFNSLDLDLANTPDMGAAAIYDHLVKLQNERSFKHPLKWLMGKPNYAWNLPPLEESPFRPEYMRLSALGVEPWVGPARSKGEKMMKLGQKLQYVGATVNVAERLDRPVKDKAIYYGKKILENFRIIGGDTDRNAGLAINDNDEIRQVFRLVEASVIFKHKYQEMLVENPSLAQHPDFIAAQDAINKLACMVKKQAVEDLYQEGRNADAQSLAESLASLPPEYTDGRETFTSLAGKLHNGFREIARMKGLPFPAHSVSPQEVAMLMAQAQSQGMQQTNTEALQYQQQLAALRAREHAGFQARTANPADLQFLKNMGINGNAPDARAAAQKAMGDLAGTKVDSHIAQISNNPNALRLAQEVNQQKPKAPTREEMLAAEQQARQQGR